MSVFLDSLATLDMPGYGYGIHYEYGLFQQEINNGYQQEIPDNWLASGTPWEIECIDEAWLIPVYGRIEHALDRDGQYNPMWMDWQILIDVPHDLSIVGYSGQTVNYLQLYSARASSEFDMQIFNAGDYLKGVEQKIASEMITKVLYPSDTVEAGQELRLVQAYFLVACASRDIVKKYLRTHTTFEAFSSQVAIQLNDTHPAVAVAELMRVLIDEHDLPWEQAWEITQATLGYTNHTLLPEALAKWSVTLFEHVLPRHLQIINEINVRFLEHVARVWPGDTARLQRMAIITEGEPRHIHMGPLAIVGSHSVNGVSALHTELVKTALVPDFFQLWPERFNNKTNGITQRCWLLQANPLLMKFALNGALTIGTLDGANIKLMQEVGEENIFIFGLHAPEIHTLRAQEAYEPREYSMRYPALKRVLDALVSNCFCRQELDLFKWIYHAHLDQGDRYFHLAALPSYIVMQAQVGAEFTNPARWAYKAILNVARVGTFSSARTIRQYAKDIWQIASIPEGSSVR
jgi:starch phosphorylase